MDILLKENNCKQQRIKFSFPILDKNDTYSSNLHTHQQEKWCFTNASRDPVPETMSTEQRCFTDLTFFRADSANIENIKADQHFFR